MPTQIFKSMKQVILPAPALVGTSIHKPSLKQLAITGGAWTAVGTIITNAIRLGGNLVITRLLAPEAFGLMALVATVLQALKMLSDTGVDTAVIQSDRGDDPDYLNTAWTIKLIREAVLFLAACALAWPMAEFYGHPSLLYLIPAVAAGVFFTGFSSTSLISLRRHLEVGQSTRIAIAQQVAGTGMAVGAAFIWPSAWALVVGSAASNLTNLALSYCLPRNFKHRFRFDPQAVRHMYRFGRWIFLSTMFTLVSLYSDRLYLGKLTTTEFLGVYTIALMFAMFVYNITIKLVHTIMYPSLTRIVRESPHRTGEIYYRFRFWLDMIIQPGAGFFVTAGSWFITLLYPPEYQAAGWVLQILSIRSAMIGILSPCETCLTALGLSRYGFEQNLARAIWVCIAIPVGYLMAGVEGIIWSIGLSELLPMAVLWGGLTRQGILRIKLELWALVWFGTGAAIGLAIVLLS